MAMHISELSPERTQEYDQFVATHSFGNIHQTRAWAELKKQTQALDSRIFILENDQKKLIGSALVLFQKLPFNTCWMYCPAGPLLDYSDTGQIQLMFQKISEVAHQKKAVFLRFDPPLEKNSLSHPFATLHSRPSHDKHYQPESTLVIDLHQSLDDILAHMKPKGRYNIRIGEKHGVKIRESDGNQKDIQSFYDLFCQTTDRNNFYRHPVTYYQKMLKIFGSKQAKLFVAEYEERVVAALIATYFKDTVTYYFGASANQDRKVMAPYVLHWNLIQQSKKDGYHYYDFFGIAPPNQASHRLIGVTEFKLKLGGKILNFVSSQEIVYRPFWYFLILVVKWLRKKIPL